jgi:hypothetical protein
MRYRLLGLLCLPALAALTLTWGRASTASAQMYGVGYPVIPAIAAMAPGATVLVNGPTTPNVQLGVAGAGVNEAPVGSASVPSGCSQYDSWCTYCGDHPGADVCLRMPDPPTSTNIVAPVQDVQPLTGPVLVTSVPVTPAAQ